MSEVIITQISYEFTQIRLCTNTMAELIYKDLGYKIYGALYEVYNNLGYGHRESVYQKALADELYNRLIPFARELRLSVFYKGQKVGEYIPDFVVDGKVILELKALEYLPPLLSTQLVNYLKGTNFRLGLLVNFGAPKLQIIRKVWGTIGEN